MMQQPACISQHQNSAFLEHNLPSEGKGQAYLESASL